MAAAPAEVGGVDPSRNFVEAAIASRGRGQSKDPPWAGSARLRARAARGDLSSGETPSPLPTRPDLAAMVDLCSSVFLRAQSECLTEEEDRGADE